MKNKLSLCLMATLAFISVCEARISHQRNTESFLGGDEKLQLQNKKQEVVPHQQIDFTRSESKAACTSLPRHIENMKKVSLATAGKSAEKIRQDEEQFYNMVLTLVRKGGDYTFSSPCFKLAKPEEEYLLSHKIDALKSIVEANTPNVNKATRSEAAFRLASLLDANKLESHRNIFTYYHIASVYGADTVAGKKALDAQVQLIETQQVSLSELPLATVTRLLNSLGASAQEKAKFIHPYAKASVKQAALRTNPLMQARMISVY